MKKSLLSILCIMIVLIASHSCAQDYLLIVRGQDFEPYHYVDQSGEQKGFIIDIVKSVADSMGLKVAFKQYSWSRCLQMVKQGRADAMMNLFKTKERMEFMSFSENILSYEVNRFFKMKKAPFKFTGNMEELFPLRVGAIRNYSYGEKFDGMNFPRLFRLETEKALVKNLINDRCDIIVGNEIVIQLLSNRMGLRRDIEILPTVISNDPLYLGFAKAKGHGKLSEKFSQALALFKQTPQYTAILSKYGL